MTLSDRCCWIPACLSCYNYSLICAWLGIWDVALILSATVDVCVSIVNPHRSLNRWTVWVGSWHGVRVNQPQVVGPCTPTALTLWHMSVKRPTNMSFGWAEFTLEGFKFKFQAINIIHYWLLLSLYIHYAVKMWLVNNVPV